MDVNKKKAPVTCECGIVYYCNFNTHLKHESHISYIRKKIDDIILNSLIVPANTNDLSRSAYQYFNSVKPSSKNRAIRENFRWDMELFIGKFFNSFNNIKTLYFGNVVPPENPFEYIKVGIFGSSVTGIIDNNSDIDLCLFVKTPTKPTKMKKIMYTLARHFECNGLKEVAVIHKARVPIIKCTDDKWGFQFDLCFDRNEGIVNSLLLGRYFAIDERAKIIAFVLKKWLKSCLVDIPLTVYCLHLMLVFFLQTRDPPVLPNLQTGIDPALIKPGQKAFRKMEKWKTNNDASIGTFTV